MSSKTTQQTIETELAGWNEPVERLRQALAKDELALYCQPIAALTGAVRFPMAEVLIRLREEEKALLPPGEFLPIFEHYKLMPDLDRWVVRHVVQHLARGSRIPRFTVNLSSQTLEDKAFPTAVAMELVSAGVRGTALNFEIGEADSIERLPGEVVVDAWHDDADGRAGRFEGGGIGEGDRCQLGEEVVLGGQAARDRVERPVARLPVGPVLT